MLDPSTKFSNRISDSYKNSYGARTQTRFSQNYRSWNNTNPVADFTAERRLIDDDDDNDDKSGVFSPPLWRTSPTRSPQHGQNHYRSLSPSSRAQAIARGQKELMDMVSRMPEGCYELSLKDIVEHTLVDADQANKKEQEDNQDQHREEESFGKEMTSIINGDDHIVRLEKKKKDVKLVQMNRSGSMDNNGGGFLLKMVFPISWGSKKKKKTINKTNSYSNSGMRMVKTNSGRDGRVSPKPLLLDGSAKNGGENEWWKNRFVEAAECESGGFSSNSGSSKSSGSSSSRSSRWNSSGRNGKGGCWFFIFGKREKKATK